MSVKQHEPMCFDSAQDRWWWNDHFLGDQIQDEWRTGGDVGGSAVVVDQQTGGIVRLTTNNVNTEEWYIDWGAIRSLHVNQRVSMETRAKLNTTTLVRLTLAMRFGGNDQIRFFYRATAGANWSIICQNGGASTSLDSGIAADISYHIFRIECHTHGGNHVHFYIDGTETNNSPINTNVPDGATDYLQPYILIFAEENVAKSADIDYVACRQDR